MIEVVDKRRPEGVSFLPDEVARWEGWILGQGEPSQRGPADGSSKRFGATRSRLSVGFESHEARAIRRTSSITDAA
jgi:hypothetical protein